MNIALKPCEMLLPAETVDITEWSVVACDQFTSQPEYWEEAERIVGEAPSTLRLILPEAKLDESEERTRSIRAAMERYLADGTLKAGVNGFVLVERMTSAGSRFGLLAAMDLEEYDYTPGARPLIRPTEETVAARVPPRARIRRGAPIELPHVMMLLDDPLFHVIEPLCGKRDRLRKLYDFDTMLSGGRLRGWAVEGEDASAVVAALEALAETCDGMLYAIGDGNHSFAAARQCWLELRETLTEEERACHPARYALAELVNLHSSALVFEPIHRILYHADGEALLSDFRTMLSQNGIEERRGEDVAFLFCGKRLGFAFEGYPLPMVQSFLDAWLSEHADASIDYVHGDDVLSALTQKHERSVGIALRAFAKSELFPSVRRFGTLPRKSFSMGEAREKRYYLEARMLR